MDVSVEDVRTLLNDLVDAMPPPAKQKKHLNPLGVPVELKYKQNIIRVMKWNVMTKQQGDMRKSDFALIFVLLFSPVFQSFDLHPACFFHGQSV